MPATLGVVPFGPTLVEFRCPTCEADPTQQRFAGDTVTCGECGTERPFVRGRLVNITGCPGTGKSTVGRLLVRRLGPEYVVVDTDLLNQPTDNVDEHTWMTFVERLLRLGVCLTHGGHTLVLVGYSTPWQWDDQPLRPFAGAIHHVALVCTDEELDRRLRGRHWIPATERDGLLELNRRFRAMTDVQHVDTTSVLPGAVADEIVHMIRSSRPIA